MMAYQLSTENKYDGLSVKYRKQMMAYQLSTENK